MWNDLSVQAQSSPDMQYAGAAAAVIVGGAIAAAFAP